MEWCNTVWIWYGMVYVWYGVGRYCLVWYGMVYNGTVQYGVDMVRYMYGMVWYVMEWCGSMIRDDIVWYGGVRFGVGMVCYEKPCLRHGMELKVTTIR